MPQTASWPYFPTLIRLGLAVAIGIFVGLEREHAKKTGVRTFALMSLLGCLAGLTAESLIWVPMSFAAIVVAFMNWRQMVRNQRLAVTTSVALVIVSFCGFLAGQGHHFTPVVCAIVTAALLAWKKRISGFATGVSDEELRSAILLAILTFVILPVLPSGPVDPWHLVEPRENWASVVIIAALGFVNYVLLKLLGPRGMEITAFFGGLVNSRKVVVELTRRLRGNDFLLPVAYRGILLSTAAMALRNGLIVVILSPIATVYCIAPLGAMIIVSTLLWFRHKAPDVSGNQVALALESPFSLSAALKFGLVFLALNVIGALAQRNFGESSFYFVSVAGGLLSSGSSIAAAATLIKNHELPVQVGVNGVVFSSVTSVVANIPLIRKLVADGDFKRKIGLSILIVAAAGLAGLALNRVV